MVAGACFTARRHAFAFVGTTISRRCFKARLRVGFDRVVRAVRDEKGGQIGKTGLDRADRILQRRLGACHIVLVIVGAVDATVTAAA